MYMIWGHFLFRFYTNEKFRVGREGTLVNIEK